MLHLRKLLSAKIVKCQGECAIPITPDTVLLVKSVGTSRYYDATVGRERSRHGAHYIHMDAECLKKYDADTFHLVDRFPWDRIMLDPKSKKALPDHEVKWLADIGVRVDTVA